jgi:hypothetical protein
MLTPAHGHVCREEALITSKAQADFHLQQLKAENASLAHKVLHRVRLCMATKFYAICAHEKS